MTGSPALIQAGIGVEMCQWIHLVRHTTAHMRAALHCSEVGITRWVAREFHFKRVYHEDNNIHIYIDIHINMFQNGATDWIGL